MKLADLIQSAVEKTPSLEIDVETVDGREYPAVFRNYLLLSEEERSKFNTYEVEGQAPAKRGAKAKEAPQEDPISKRARLAKAGLALVLRPIEGTDVMADLEEVFSQNPETRDLAWIGFEGEWAKATQLGEAEPSQES